MLGPRVRKLQSKNCLKKLKKNFRGSVSSCNFKVRIFLYFFPERHCAKVYWRQISEQLICISIFGEFFKLKKSNKIYFSQKTAHKKKTALRILTKLRLPPLNLLFSICMPNLSQFCALFFEKFLVAWVRERRLIKRKKLPDEECILASPRAPLAAKLCGLSACEASRKGTGNDVQISTH